MRVMQANAFRTLCLAHSKFSINVSYCTDCLLVCDSGPR